MELRKQLGQLKRKFFGATKDQGEQLFDYQISELFSQNKILTLASNLKQLDGMEIKSQFENFAKSPEWTKVENKMIPLKLPQYTGGVNIGDQKAIYSLLRYLKPKNVLEIGTHIGCSTVHIFEALLQTGGEFKFTSLDIRDVNDENTKPWLGFKSVNSPRTLTEMLSKEQKVNFIVDQSTKYLETTNDRYDFIFLDGDHAALTVYREIPNAMRILNPGGVILLHDYYPKCQPLFSDNHVVPGPFLGAQRLMDLNQNFKVIPLGELPWPTKLGSKFTSLAVVSAL